MNLQSISTGHLPSLVSTQSLPRPMSSSQFESDANTLSHFAPNADQALPHILVIEAQDENMNTTQHGTECTTADGLNETVNAELLPIVDTASHSTQSASSNTTLSRIGLRAHVQFSQPQRQYQTYSSCERSIPPSTYYFTNLKEMAISIPYAPEKTPYTELEPNVFHHNEQRRIGKLSASSNINW